MTEESWWDQVSTSALLRAAFHSYADVVRAAVAGAGFDDLPKNGAYVLSATATGSLSMRHLPSALGITKQAFSQLVDALVLRGYAERASDAEDRRRLRLVLSGRGREVADLVGEVGHRADEVLLDLIGDAEKISNARWVLATMTLIPSDLAGTK